MAHQAINVADMRYDVSDLVQLLRMQHLLMLLRAPTVDAVTCKPVEHVPTNRRKQVEAHKPVESYRLRSSHMG